MGARGRSNGRPARRGTKSRETSREDEPRRSPGGGGGTLPKAPTGIEGLDQVTLGGLPRGRPTLICGGPGCGKTLMAMEFLVRGATQFDEPGVLVSFEESAEELTQNVASLGFNLDDLIAAGRLVVDFVRVERSEIEETGEYDLEGLFIRLGHAIDSVGAKRVVLDTIESLFSGFMNQATLRAELRRLFRWLKDRGVTAVITGERGEGQLTRQGLEEYVSDCVILLDHRVVGQVSTRRLRVVKYRGTTHGTNEYPFLIDEQGISVLPVTSLGLNHPTSDERISTGVPRLDAMLGGEGLYRGSTTLISGTAGSGKTSLSAAVVAETARRGERCLYCSFEESPAQITRNMASIGIDLDTPRKSGLLRFMAARPTSHGLEMHLVMLHKEVERFKPSVVVLDPITSLLGAGAFEDAEAMLIRLIDFLKSRGITGVFTSLTRGGEATERTEANVSSLMDTWLLVQQMEVSGERNRGLYVLKSRGMSHSNQVREFLISGRGIELVDVYTGPSGVLTGSARAAKEAQDEAEEAQRRAEVVARERALDRKRKQMEAQIAALHAEIDAEESELSRMREQEELRRRAAAEVRRRMGERRGIDEVGNDGDAGGRRVVVRNGRTPKGATR